MGVSNIIKLSQIAQEDPKKKNKYFWHKRDTTLILREFTHHKYARSP